MAELKFIALSGTTEVTENLYIYEYGNDMLVVDCGVGFPEQDMYGVDLVIPDFSYIIENKHKIRGILVSHGHEDHLGALPFLLKDVKVSVYATKLVAGFIEEKLQDYKVETEKVKIFDPESDTLSLGVFNVTPFRVSHSVPDAVGFAIDTPEGKVFHVPDYKFDWTPVDQKPFDVAKAAQLASGGVLALASDCLGSTTPGYTESEFEIEEKIETIVKNAKKTVYFTTISSNISRIQQAMNVAERAGRKVTFVGRSIDSKAEIAKTLGYLHYNDKLVVTKKQARNIRGENIMYIISGSYGQPGSNLYRVALGEHDSLAIEQGDAVIFSGDPAPPGSKVNVDMIVDKLIELGADVHYYDLQEDLHVSGHGSMQDIKMLFALLKPKHFIPIGGTVRHMRAYKEIALSMGARDDLVFNPKPGDIISFTNGFGRTSGNVPVKSVLVDGLGIGDVGEVVLRDRQTLAQDGIAIVLIQVDSRNNKLTKNPELISRGFVFQGKQQGFLEKVAKDLGVEITKRGKFERQTIKETTFSYLERVFYKETGRHPMIIPLVVEE